MIKNSIVLIEFMKLDIEGHEMRAFKDAKKAT